MFIPRFSLRTLLLLMTAAALVSSIVMFAVRGHVWAIAMGVAMASLVVTVGTHVLFFLFSWLFSRPWRPVESWRGGESWRGDESGCPRGLPPQLLPPLDVE